MSGRLTHAALRALDRLQPKAKAAEHLQTGKKGEEEAYFYLRKLGYVMVARNWRTPRRKGELDLVGYDGDVLCFIEVKTRTTLDVMPAEAAVDADKQRELREMAQEFVRLLMQRKRPASTLTTETLRHEGSSFLSSLRASVSQWWVLAAGRPASAALRENTETPQTRFDILSIYLLPDCGKTPRFTLFKDCFSMA